MKRTKRNAQQLDLLRQAQNTGERRMIESYLNANRHSPDWGERAHWALAAFANRRRGQKFTAEEARVYVEEKKLLDRPHDGRAYGAVFRRAIKLGLIRRVGFAPTIANHGGLRPVYERVRINVRA